MADELDDRQLLAAYAGRSAQDAFAQVVRRHVRFVYACALRQTRDAATAEDVTQTVFTLLARQADAVSKKRGPLRGWLFAVARYAASNERRAATRRRHHERRAARPEASQPDDRSPNVAEISDLLDGALAKLSRADREAVLLRYFEGEDASAVAAALGVSEQAARRRISRAVERMRKYFAASGVAASSAAVSAALASPPQAPPELAEKVASSATRPSDARLAIVSALARAMALRAATIAAVWLLAGVIGLAGAALVVNAASRNLFRPAAAAVPPPVRPSRPLLALTLAWNGQALSLPMPATFPEEIRQTDEYRRWESTGGARTFTWSTRDGRTYRCRAVERGDGAGRTVASIALVQRYRPDGTLEIETACDEQGAPRQWTIFAPDGKTKLARYDTAGSGGPGGPFVQSVRLYDLGGTVREYLAEPNGTVHAEWLLGAGGKRVRLLNGAG